MIGSSQIDPHDERQLLGITFNNRMSLAPRSAVCWGSENTCLLKLFNKINVRDVRGLLYTYQAFGGHRVTSPGAVRVQFEAGVLQRRSLLSMPNLFDQQTEDLCEGIGGTCTKISHLLTFTWPSSPTDHAHCPHQGRRHGRRRRRRKVVRRGRALSGQEAPGRHQQQGRHEGRWREGWHQPRRRQEVLQLTGGWPPPTPVSV